MANNYTQSSSMLAIPKDKREQAQRIIDSFTEQILNDDEDYLGIVAELEAEGIWLHDYESFDVDQAVDLVQRLLDELEIEEPFAFSWAYTCSKPRLDEFGGGACAVRKGQAPLFIDARSHIETLLDQQKSCQQDTQQH